MEKIFGISDMITIKQLIEHLSQTQIEELSRPKAVSVQ